MHPTLSVAWQVVLFCSWIFRVVQLVPYILQEEIMERMSERISRILQLRNLWKRFWPVSFAGSYFNSLTWPLPWSELILLDTYYYQPGPYSLCLHFVQLGQTQLTSTNAPWRMDGVWIGNKFSLCSCPIANQWLVMH
jgi:hypothetical protein